LAVGLSVRLGEFDAGIPDGTPEGAGVGVGLPHAAAARAATARRERIRVFTLFSCLSGVSRGAAAAAV
jgi:hypothetical protein